MFRLRHLLLLSLAFLIIRLLFVGFMPKDFTTAEDYAIAQNLVAGKGYVLDEHLGPTAIKAPGYPLFLAAILSIPACDTLCIVVVQHVLMSLVPILLALFLRTITDEKTALIAGGLFLLHPSYLYYPSVLEVTNVFVPLSLVWMIMLVAAKRTRGIPMAGLAGICSAAMVLTQPIALVPVIAAVFFFFSRLNKRHGLIILIVMLGVVSAWSYRNYAAFGRFIPTKSPFWMNIYLGFLPAYTGSDEFDVIPAKDKEHVTRLSRELNDVEMEPIYKQVVLKTVSKHPWLFARKALYQAAVYWWVPPRYFSNNSTGYLLVRKIPVVLLNILSVLGLYVLYRQNRALAMSIILVLAYFTAVYGLTTIVNTRFKLDIEWVQLIPIAFLVHRLIEAAQARNARQSA